MAWALCRRVKKHLLSMSSCLRLQLSRERSCTRLSRRHLIKTKSASVFLRLCNSRSTFFVKNTLQLLQTAPHYAQYVPDDNTRRRLCGQITNYLKQYVLVLTENEVTSASFLSAYIIVQLSQQDRITELSRHMQGMVRTHTRINVNFDSRLYAMWKRTIIECACH